MATTASSDVPNVITFLKALAKPKTDASGADIKSAIIVDIDYAVSVLEALKAETEPLPAPLDKIKADADKIETALKLFQFFVNLYPTQVAN